MGQSVTIYAIGTWVVGARFHHQLQALTIGSSLLVAVASAGLLSRNHVLVYAAALRGLVRGGIPALPQTAVGDAGGEQAAAADPYQTPH